MDLTGSRVIMTVKKKITDVECILRKDSDKGIAEVDIVTPRGGIAQIFILPSDTRSLDCREYIFDVWVVLSSGKQHPVVKTSVFEIVAGVTVIT